MDGHAGEAGMASDRHRAKPRGSAPAEERQEPSPHRPFRHVRGTPGPGRPDAPGHIPAFELGVELSVVEGTGPQGRVTENDVRRVAAAEGLSPGHVQEGRREKLRGVRRLVAEHMARAHQEVPPVTWVEECDFGNADLRRLVPLTLKAVAESLREFPELNARLEGDELVYLDRYDIGGRRPTTVRRAGRARL
jgi:pyruvate/2-oxoglutarate dehydrogenase complex dihydrolipoamide acyltransferase (E2) component